MLQEGQAVDDGQLLDRDTVTIELLVARLLADGTGDGPIDDTHGGIAFGGRSGVAGDPHPDVGVESLADAVGQGEAGLGCDGGVLREQAGIDIGQFDFRLRGIDDRPPDEGGRDARDAGHEGAESTAGDAFGDREGESVPGEDGRDPGGLLLEVLEVHRIDCRGACAKPGGSVGHPGDMPSIHAERRLAVAAQIADIYGAAPDIHCIVVGGSVARDTADRWSDLDVIITRDEVNLGSLEPAPLAHMGNRFTCVSLHPGTCTEQYMIGALKVDVAHVTPSFNEEFLRKVHEELDVSPEVQGTVYGLATAIVLVGEAYFAPIREEASRYEEAYGRKIVESSLFFMPRWVFESHCLERGDLLQFDCHRLNALKGLFALLGAMNGAYVDTTYCKHLLERSKGWLVLPEDYGNLIDGAIDGDRAVALEALMRLVDRTLTLVELRYPEVDTSRARRMQGMELGAYEG